MGLVEALARYEARPESDRDEAFARFQAARAALSRACWDKLAAGVCRNGAITRAGVELRPLDAALAAQFRAALAAAPVTTLRREDFAPGYLPTLTPWILAYHNRVNEYRVVTPSLTALVAGFLAAKAREIETVCGHPWRVGSLRAFYLKPNEPNQNTHLDGWPVSLKKLFILPAGANREIGSTYFKLKTGEGTQIETGPAWMIFENSVVEHTARSGPIGMRPTVEVDILPAAATDPRPREAGINGWYPWFPAGTARRTLRALALSKNLRLLWR